MLPADQSKQDEVFIGGLPSNWKAQQVWSSGWVYSIGQRAEWGLSPAALFGMLQQGTVHACTCRYLGIR
jgi:hypothetical protein